MLIIRLQARPIAQKLMHLCVLPHGRSQSGACRKLPYLAAGAESTMEVTRGAREERAV